MVQHLTRIHSDHNPILLKLFKDKGLGLPKPFQFQSMWLSHPTYTQVVQDTWVDNGPLEDTMLTSLKEFRFGIRLFLGMSFRIRGVWKLGSMAFKEL